MTGEENKPGHSRCQECGFRIRGKNHEDGPHHNGPHRSAEKPTDPEKLQQKRRW